MMARLFYHNPLEAEKRQTPGAGGREAVKELALTGMVE